MDKNEVKKILYKENPTAVLQYISNGSIYYQTKIKEGVWAYHKIPAEDTINGHFDIEMESKLLIRWLMDGVKIQVGEEV